VCTTAHARATDELARAESALRTEGAAAIPRVVAVLDTLEGGGRAGELERLVLELDPSAVRRTWFSGVDASASPAARRLALAFLEEYGERGDVVRIASLLGTEDAADGKILGRSTGALTAILLRDGRAFHEVGSLLAKLRGERLATAIDGVVFARDTRGLVPLSERIGSDRESTRSLLVGIGVLASEAAPPHDSRVLDRVRRLQRSSEPEVSGAAITVLGKLQDDESTAYWIECLSNDSGERQTAALGALRQLSGRSYPANADRWTSWLAGERRWWDEQAPDLLARLESCETRELAAVLRELVLHPLYRHRIARSVTSCLPTLDDAGRRLACVSLGELRSPAALDALRRLETDDDEATRAAARAARARVETRE
jgi:hypothetical protein